VPSWLFKAAAQGAISLLPGRHRLNRMLQEHVTGSLALTPRLFEAKVAQCRHHLMSVERRRAARELARPAGAQAQPPRSALELGTGWYPIVPVGLALAGVEQVTTVDVSPLLDGARVARVVDLYAQELADGRLDALPGLDPARAGALLTRARERSGAGVDEVLAQLNVRSVVGDVRQLALPSNSFDLLVSDNTLEHIPAQTLDEVLPALAGLAAPGAVMDHFIDLSDHYAHFDDSITEFNYLRFSPAAWRLFNNRLQYQNRLRASDYRRLFEQAGLEVVAQEDQSGEASQLSRVNLADHFRDYEAADLLVLRTWLTAVAPA
jgi:hypothetical protein